MFSLFLFIFFFFSYDSLVVVFFFMMFLVLMGGFRLSLLIYCFRGFGFDYFKFFEVL